MYLDKDEVYRRPPRPPPRPLLPDDLPEDREEVPLRPLIEGVERAVGAEKLPPEKLLTPFIRAEPFGELPLRENAEALCLPCP